jgi:hypothetical protein
MTPVIPSGALLGTISGLPLTWKTGRYSRLQQLLRGLVTPPCLHVVPKDLREPDQKNTCDSELFQLEFPNFWLINLAASLFHSSSFTIIFFLNIEVLWLNHPLMGHE